MGVQSGDDVWGNTAAKVFDTAYRLSRSIEEERANQPLCDWGRHAPCFQSLIEAISAARELTRRPGNGFAPVAEVLKSTAETARRIRAVSKRSDAFPDDYWDFAFELASLAARGWDALKQYNIQQTVDDPLDLDAFLNQSASEAAFTRLDTFPLTAEGCLEFVEWVLREVNEQATILRDGNHGSELVDRQVKRGVRWAEARMRVELLCGLPADVLQQLKGVLDRSLTVDTVLRVNDLFAQAAGAARDAWETHRADQRRKAGRLAPYYTEIRARQDKWLADYLRAAAESGHGKMSGCSHWSSPQNREWLAKLDRRFGIAPDDSRVYSIATYEAERQALDEEWEQTCRLNSWDLDGVFFGTISPAHWIASCTHNARRDDLDARHFGPINTASIELSSRRLLWAHLHKLAIPFLETMRAWSGPDTSRGEDVRAFATMERVFSTLHRLKLPWAHEPPYPRLSLQESIDKLYAIANRLECDELQSIQAQVSPLQVAQANAQREHAEKQLAAEQGREALDRRDRLESAWEYMRVNVPHVYEERGIDYASCAENVLRFCELAKEFGAAELFQLATATDPAELTALSLVKAGLESGRRGVEQRLLELSQQNDRQWMGVFNHNTLFWRIMRPTPEISPLPAEEAAFEKPQVNDAPAKEVNIPTAPIASDKPSGDLLGKLAELQDDVFLPSTKLAELLGLDHERLRQRLKRFRKQDLDCFVEDSNRKSGQPQYLYRVRNVRRVLAAAVVATGGRPSRKK
jgi:hypothetical protein